MSNLPRSTRFLRRSLVGVIHLVRLVLLGHGDIGESVRDLKLFQSSGDIEELLETNGTVLIGVDFSEDVTNRLVIRLKSESSHRLAEIVGTDLSIVVGIELSEALLKGCEFVGVEDGAREVVIIGREVNFVSTSSNVLESQFAQSSLTQSHRRKEVFHP